MRSTRLALVAGVFGLMSGCGGSPEPIELTAISSVAGASTPVPTAVPTALPTPVPTPHPISYVRVGFFGVKCPGGGAPDNAERKLPVGCAGDVTATPKKENGTDVHSDDHGAEITWELMHGERLVSLYDVPGQPFNKHLIGRIAGPFMLCATVKGVMGCLTAEVTP